MTWSPWPDRHLHADDHRLLADVEVAEAADQPHAVELARLLLEAADEQHVAVGGKLLLAGERRDGVLAVGAGHGRGKPCGCGVGHVGLGQSRGKTVQETLRAGQPRRMHGCPAPSHSAKENPVSRPGKAQPLDGQLLYEVGVARLQQPHVTLQARTRGLEAGNLVLQYAGALDQTRSGLVAAPAAGCVIGEIADRQQTAKRDQCLPPPALAPIIHAIYAGP